MRAHRNRSESQKIKDELVFKLLQSMGPYNPNTQLNNKARQQLQQIRQQQQINASNNESDNNNTILQQQQQQSILEHNNKINKKVYGIKIINGKYYDENGKEILYQNMNMELMQSKLLLRNIQAIQSQVFTRFGISKQFTQHNNSNMYNNYSKSIMNSNSNNMSKSNMYNMHNSNKMYYSNHNNSSKLLNSNFYTTTHSQYNNNTSNIYNNINNSNIEKDNIYQNMRLSLTKIDSKSKLYRHEQQKYKQQYNNYRIQSARVLNTSQLSYYNKNNKQKQQKHSVHATLGLQSNISNNSNHKQYSKRKINISKSQIILNNKQETKSAPNYKNVANNKQKCKINANSKIYNNNNNNNNSIQTNNSLKNNNITISNKKIKKSHSQKVIKQSSKLDHAILSSILHNRIKNVDKSYTIATLIK